MCADFAKKCPVRRPCFRYVTFIMNNDFVFVGFSIAFFVLSAAYAHFCGKVR
jgi:hypothetical protein